MDGANCAVSFDADGKLLLQSCGHFLTGGPRERQFHLFKTWAARYTSELWEALGMRYVMYSEWLYGFSLLYSKWRRERSYPAYDTDPCQ